MSFEMLTSVGRRLNWCGRQYHVMRYGECYVALRSQRTNHVLHCEYTSTGENLKHLIFLVLPSTVAKLEKEVSCLKYRLQGRSLNKRSEHTRTGFTIIETDQCEK